MRGLGDVSDGFGEDWLGESLGDQGLSDDSGLGHNRCGVSVDCRLLNVSSWLLNVGCWLLNVCCWLVGIGDGLVAVVDDASVVFADTRVRCVDRLRDVADCSETDRAHDVLLRRSVLVVTVDGLGGVDVVFWLMVVAGDGVLLSWLVAVVAGDGWLGLNVGLWLRVRDSLGVRRR